MRFVIIILLLLTSQNFGCKSMKALPHDTVVKMYEEAETIHDYLTKLLPQLSEQKEVLQQMMNRMQIAGKPMDLEKFDLWEKIQLEIGELTSDINELEGPTDSGSQKTFEAQESKYRGLKARAEDLMKRIGGGHRRRWEGVV